MWDAGGLVMFGVQVVRGDWCFVVELRGSEPAKKELMVGKIQKSVKNSSNTTVPRFSIHELQLCDIGCSRHIFGPYVSVVTVPSHVTL